MPNHVPAFIVNGAVWNVTLPPETPQYSECMTVVPSNTAYILFPTNRLVHEKLSTYVYDVAPTTQNNYLLLTADVSTVL